LGAADAVAPRSSSLMAGTVVALDVDAGFALVEASTLMQHCKLAVQGWCVGSESDDLCPFSR
jgi:hypothetical protein